MSFPQLNSYLFFNTIFTFLQEKGKKKAKKSQIIFIIFIIFIPQKSTFDAWPTQGKKEDVAALRPAK